jgi:hypothetical protein
VTSKRAASGSTVPHGAHRPSADAVPLRVRAIGAGVCVLLVFATVGVLLSLGGHPAVGDVSFGQSARGSPPRPAAPSASPTPSLAASPSAAPAASGATSAVPHSAVRPPAPVAHAPLTVLNNSTIKDLGETSAARFRAGGWAIAAIDGITGRYRYTTVYYGPGQIEAARALVRQFPGIKVIDSRANVPDLPGSGLTVVVTKDFR